MRKILWTQDLAGLACYIVFLFFSMRGGVSRRQKEKTCGRWFVDFRSCRGCVFPGVFRAICGVSGCPPGSPLPTPFLCFIFHLFPYLSPCCHALGMGVDLAVTPSPGPMLEVVSSFFSSGRRLDFFCNPFFL